MGFDVFLCYNRADRDAVIAIAERLRHIGLRVWIDEWELRPGKRWITEVEKQIETVAAAVVLVGADGQGPWQTPEVHGLLEQVVERECTVIPVLLPECPAEPKLPLFLKGLTWVDFRRSLPDPFDRLVWGITGEKPARSVAPAPAVAAPAVEDVTLKLPVTDSQLFGRDATLAALDAAWSGPSRKHVVSLVAWGGVGKTALVNRWLAGLAREGWRGAARVFGWTFYSQGTRHERAASSDEMIAALLRQYGDPDPTVGSPEEKGARLARLVRAKRTLLILDGVEPLQHPPGPDEGRIKDPALATLLRELAADNPGLCVLSTRLAVADLADWEAGPAERIELEALTPEAGAEVLAAHGVRGDRAELEEASREYGGHALALSLLGRYLKRRFEGDVQRRREVGPLEAETTRGQHAARVMEAYARWWGESKEIAVLHILGLFDRPAKAEALASLRPARGAAARRMGVAEIAPIPGLTDKLASYGDWQEAVANLRTAGLVAPADSAEPGTLDTHPLVREHFGERLKRRNLAAWRGGHGRLFEYYQRAAPEFPDTLEAMAPLYAAVGHGCRAERHSDALELFWHRIQRRKHYAVKALGSAASDLSALFGFFDRAWDMVVPHLAEPDRGFIFNSAGNALMALGRLLEAVEALSAALAIAGRDLQNVGASASSLALIHLSLGRLDEAAAFTSPWLDLAHEQRRKLEQSAAGHLLGAIAYAAGDRARGRELFNSAQQGSSDVKVGAPQLAGLPYYLFGDFLLAEGRADLALQQTEHSAGDNYLLDVGLTHLLRGRSAMAVGQCMKASKELDLAVVILRQAAFTDDIARGLLARADLHLTIAESQSDAKIPTELAAARTDLDEVTGLATRCGMRLFEADAALAWTRWHLLAGDPDAARRHLARARHLVETTGYHRRDADIAALEARLTQA